MSQSTLTGESGNQNQIGTASIVIEDSSDVHTKPQQCQHDTDGHKGFLPVAGLTVDKLPPELQDDEVFEIINTISDLTVKINVSQQTGGALEGEAGAEDRIPCHTKKSTTGSGIICTFKKHDTGSHCPCIKCQESGTPRKLWVTVEIVTASTVVEDDAQALQAEAMLDFSSCCSSGASQFFLNGFTVIERNGENSFTLLEHVTCDTTLIGQLEKCTLTFEDQRVRVYRKYAGKYKDLKNNILMVSYSDSSSKHVSFGSLKVVHYSSAWSKLVHTAPACPGCEGAFVYFLGCSGGVWPYPHVHVQRLASGSSYTSYGIIAKKL